MANKRPSRRGGGPAPARPARPIGPVVPLDAEDIAMARLQAHLRKTETVRVEARRGATPLIRTTVRLPRVMLQRVRDRARRDGATVSEVVEVALERYLKSP